MITIITSCSARKDDSIPIPKGSRIVQPSYYLDNVDLISRLLSIREHIFQDVRSCSGRRTTYAFDLYVRAGNAYRNLRKDNYSRLKAAIISGEIEWFFLSGGYGIVHALETARKYQATFNRSIARKKNIPLTANLWETALTSLCDAIISKFNPEWVYIFGSRDYTSFIKKTDFWRANNAKMFESTGSAGPFWISPKLDDLADSILNNNLERFNRKHSRFVKQ